MFFIWQGWGIVVPVVPFLALVLAQLAADAVFGPGAYQRSLNWLPALALLPAAFALYRLGRRLNARSGRNLVDPATGETVVLWSRHSFWLVRVEHWGIVVAVGALVILAIELLA